MQYNPATQSKDQKYQESSNRHLVTSPPPVADDAAADDPFAFLRDFDTIFLIDDSGSMYGERWNQTRKALEAIVPICTSHDADGIDIYFLNNHNNATKDSFGPFRNVTSLDAVKEIFDKVSPDGTTPTGQRLEDIIRPYLNKLSAAAAAAAAAAERHVEDGEMTITTMMTEDDSKAKTTKTKTKTNIIKPLNIIVITDGCPSDEKHLESVIVNTAKELDYSFDPPCPAWQIGIQFFQVGEDQRATESLMDLDDKLKDKYKIRDMVDTVPWKSGSSSGSSLDGAFILKVVTGAVNRRLDRRRVV